MSLGDAFIEIHSDGTHFEEELLTQVRAAIKAAEAIAKVSVAASARVVQSSVPSAAKLPTDVTQTVTQKVESSGGSELIREQKEASALARRVAADLAVENAEIRQQGIEATNASRAIISGQNAAAATARRVAGDLAVENAELRQQGIELDNIAKAGRAVTASIAAEDAEIRQLARDESLAAKAAVDASRVKIAASNAAAAATRAETAEIRKGAASAGSGVRLSPGSPSGIADFQAASQAAAAAARDAAAEAELEFNATTKVAQKAFAEQAAASRETDAAIVESRRVLIRTNALLYQVDVAAAREADAERLASARAADKAIAAEAKAAAAAAKNSFAGGFSKQFDSIPKDLGKKFADSLKGIPGDVFGAVTTSAKYATVGVLGLGAALIGIGVSAAAKQQAALVGFTALADQISATTDKVTGLNVATEGLTQAQQAAIGNDFLQRLIDLSNNSAIAQSNLQDVTQQLLALGFNGDQTIGIVRDIGNALAASGKTGGALNDSLAGVVTAFAQIKGAGRLLAQDLNQITTRIPSATRTKVYLELAKNIGIADKSAKALDKSQTAALRKTLEAGGIDSDTAIASITKVLEGIPGAAKDAATGLDALGRQNNTLSGSFEALKDNIRSSLAKAFIKPTGPEGKSLADSFAVQIQALTKQVTAAIEKAGPQLSKFVTGFADLATKALPPLVTLIGNVFEGLGKGLDSVKSALPGIIDGFKKFGDLLSKVGLGPALKEAFDAIAEAIPPILVAVGGIVVGLTPVLSIVASLARIFVAVLGPAIEGAAEAIGAVGVALAPLAALLRPIADFVVKIFGNEIVQQVLKFVGAFGAFAGAMLGISALIPIVVAAVGTLATALGVLFLELTANPVGLTIVAIAALAVAFEKAWKASETFRNVVIKVLQVVAHIATAQVQLIILTLEKLLDALAAVAHTIGKLPGIPDLSGPIKEAADALGGLNSDINHAIDSIGNLAGANAHAASTADDLRSALQSATGQMISASANAVELNSILATLPEQKQIDIQIKIFTSIGQQNTDFLNANNIPLTGLEDATGFSTAGIQDAANKAAKSANDAATSVADGLIAGLPTTTGGGSGAKVQSAAQKAASTFRDAIKSIVAGLDKDFKNSLVTGTAKQIDTALDSLSKKIHDAFKAAGKSQPSKLLADIQKDNTKLKALAKERDGILDKLKQAQDKAKEVSDGVKSFGDITSLGLDTIATAAGNATTKLADLSHLRIIKPGQDALNTLTGGSAATAAATAQTFADTLKQRLAAIKEFQANIAKLIKAGLNKNTLDQIISAGVENGGGVAATLAGGTQATIDSINTTQKAIDKAAKQLGNTAADSLFRSGTQVVAGLISGLKSQAKEIKAAMKDIADALVDEIKKRLKIKSPSRRMGEEVGAHIIPGIVGHMDHSPLRQAMADVADTLASHAPKLAPIKLDALASLAQAEARLKLDASLAPASVQLLAPKHAEAAWTPSAVARHLALLEASAAPVAPAGRVYQPTPPPTALTTVRGVSSRSVDRAVRGVR